VDDKEIIILRSYLYKTKSEEKYEEFLKEHESVLWQPMSFFDSEQEEIDKVTIYQAHEDHLERLNLISPKYSKLDKGEMPEFNQLTGKIKTQGNEITSLGNLLLRVADLND